MPQAFSGPELRRRRERAGMSRDQLGVAIDRCSYSVWRYEAGRASPSADVLPRLAFAVGCRVEDLFVEEPDRAAG